MFKDLKGTDLTKKGANFTFLKTIRREHRLFQIQPELLEWEGSNIGTKMF